jgi:hypothetical protein
LNDHERRCGAIPIDGHAVAIHAQQTTIGKYQAAYKEYYRSHGSWEEQDLALIAGQGFIQLDSRLEKGAPRGTPLKGLI